MRASSRPTLRGTFGMVASTHWLASGVGMAVLERGGNAFDAAVAAGLTLQVVEPHMNGPGGDLPVLFWSASAGEPLVLCAQGPAPALATVAEFRERGLPLVPAVGPLAACVPGAFDGWMRLLRDHGTWRLADVIAFAIGYARDGFPAIPAIVAAVRSAEPLLRQWPASAELYLPVLSGRSGVLRNPVLAACYERLVAEGVGGRSGAPAGSREEEIERARAAWYRGYVAEAIDAFCVTNDALLRGSDLAAWSSSVESPLRYDVGRFTVCKPGPWSQGPVFLQQLALLSGFDLGAMGLGSAEYVHTIVECAKLAFADREAFYGDPAFADVPVEMLLSEEYNAGRRGLVGESASMELRPGGGRLPSVDVDMAALSGTSEPGRGGAEHGRGGGEPGRGDTVHLDVADRFGNLVCATPSGGWLQSSPVIPGLGFPLGTRAQMFWLDEEHPNGLAPGKRPRTTLSPSLALRDGEPCLAFGTPGGDGQDQWPLQFFLAHAVFGLDLQTALDLPEFDTRHMPSSFYPRRADPGVLEADGDLGSDVLDDLRARGHLVQTLPAEAFGRTSAAGRERDGTLVAGATGRGMVSFAVGR